jgi:CheY-like chemotaxis protein
MLMSSLEATVGTERFLLALQSEARKSVEADWKVISTFDRLFKPLQTTLESGTRAAAVVSSMLNKHGYEARVVASGKDALVELEDHPSDL